MADIKKIKIGSTEYNVKDVVSGYTTVANLTELSDVSISSPTQGQNLTYDATNQVWKNTSTSATVAWGGVTGTLSDQTDLASALSDKYDASNPDGFTSNVGTVTSVNNTSPDSNGDVTIALPTSGVGLRTVSNAFDIMQDDDPSSAYSVVGTLTTDAANKYKYSGFSNANYIEATGEFSCGATDTVEIVFCGLSTYTPASGNTYVGHFIGANIRRETNGNLSWTPRKAFHGSANNTQIIKYNTDTSNYPYLKLVRTCTDSSTTFDLYYSSNGTNWTLDNTKTYTNVSYRADFTDYIRIGQIGDSENQYWRDGWADLTGCYVKVNNVMIWNPTSWDNIKQAAKATTSLYGLVKPDGTTISVNNGVISAVNNGTITDVLVDSVSVVNNGIASISFGNLIKTSKSSAQTIQLSSGSDDTALKLQSRASSSYLSLYGISGFLGSYGVNSSNKPVFYNGTYYTLATTDDIPTSISDLMDDTATTPIDKADTLTGLTATVSELNILDGVTATTTELNYVDGVTSDIQTQIDGKANTSLSNLTSTSSTNFDGQWVKINTVSLYDGNARTTNYDVDVSSYLPNDNYAYEVLIGALVVSGSTSGNVGVCWLTTDYVTQVRTAQARTRTSSANTVEGCAILPLKNRKITIVGFASNTGTLLLEMYAYRRIGTNS